MLFCGPLLCASLTLISNKMHYNKNVKEQLKEINGNGKVFAGNTKNKILNNNFCPQLLNRQVAINSYDLIATNVYLQPINLTNLGNNILVDGSIFYSCNKAISSSNTNLQIEIKQTSFIKNVVSIYLINNQKVTLNSICFNQGQSPTYESLIQVNTNNKIEINNTISFRGERLNVESNYLSYSGNNITQNSGYGVIINSRLSFDLKFSGFSDPQDNASLRIQSCILESTIQNLCFNSSGREPLFISSGGIHTIKNSSFSGNLTSKFIEVYMGVLTLQGCTLSNEISKINIKQIDTKIGRNTTGIGYFETAACARIWYAAPHPKTPGEPAPLLSDGQTLSDVIGIVVLTISSVAIVALVLLIIYFKVIRKSPSKEIEHFPDISDDNENWESAYNWLHSARPGDTQPLLSLERGDLTDPEAKKIKTEKATKTLANLEKMRKEKANIQPPQPPPEVQPPPPPKEPEPEPTPEPAPEPEPQPEPLPLPEPEVIPLELDVSIQNTTQDTQNTTQEEEVPPKEEEEEEEEEEDKNELKRKAMEVDVDDLNADNPFTKDTQFFSKRRTEPETPQQSESDSDWGAIGGGSASGSDLWNSSSDAENKDDHKSSKALADWSDSEKSSSSSSKSSSKSSLKSDKKVKKEEKKDKPDNDEDEDSWGISTQGGNLDSDW